MLEILQGDCLSVLRGLPERSVQMCVTSPPYFGLRDYNCEGQIGLESSVDEYVAKLVEIFREVRRVLHDDGTLWLNLGDTYAASRSYQVPDNKHGHPIHAKGAHRVPAGLKQKDLIGIPWRCAFALQADGWYLRSDIIWSKPNAMPESVRDRPTKAHEYLFLLSKQERYYYDHEAIKEPVKADTLPRYARGRSDDHKYADGGPGNQTLARSLAHMLPKTPGRNSRMFQDRDPDHPTARKSRSGNKERKPRPDAPASHGGAQAGSIPWEGTMRNRRTVWSVATSPCKEAHFATFPAKLIEPCILAGSRPGDVVLDPFFGAGTTGMVALEHGRRCLGIELNPDYIAIARRRLGLDRVAA